jgi:hypothetical protein
VKGNSRTSSVLYEPIPAVRTLLPPAVVEGKLEQLIAIGLLSECYGTILVIAIVQ